jgi:hypothetical protein
MPYVAWRKNRSNWVVVMWGYDFLKLLSRLAGEELPYLEGRHE